MIKIEAAGKHLVKITHPDGKGLAQAFIRFQEYYESPHNEIRGKVFTTGYLKSLGSSRYDRINNYCGGLNIDAKWGGYNFPDYVLTPFIKGLFEPLTSEETDIVEALRYRTDKFYVIGISEDYVGAVDHEECHALYYISEEYRAAVNQILKKEDLSGLFKLLKRWGYADEVLLDEAHAYLSADYHWLFSEHKSDMKRYKVHINEKVHEKLIQVKGRFKKCL